MNRSPEYPIWHPFSQMKSTEIQSIRSADGLYLVDQEGNRIMDAISSWWVNLHGHAHPYINEKLSEQAKKLEHVIFAGFTHDGAVELAERLLNKLQDPFKRIFYSDNGSTATEVALKMAIQFWYNREGESTRRRKVIAFNGSYHGDTFGAMSVGERDVFVAPFVPMLFDVIYMDIPTSSNIDDLENELKSHCTSEEVAAFIFEPLVQGAAGMQMYSPGHLDRLLAVCKTFDVLTIADEVMTGFGRTGSFFAIHQLQEGVDMVCLSKGLTGGYLPMGVTACSEAIYQCFYSDDLARSFFHGHSFTGNPLSCAVALASLDLMEETTTKNQMAMISFQMTEFLSEIRNLQMVKNPRVKGTILAFEVEHGKDLGYLDPLAKVMYKKFIDRGVLLRPIGNTVYILPPYCITVEELQSIFKTIIAVLDEL